MKKSLIIIILTLAVSFSAIAQTCDTLFNLRSNLDTATLLQADTVADAGYISGNNIYGDQAISEAFAVPDTGLYMTSATLYFGMVNISAADSNKTVAINVWDNTGTSLMGTGAPGTVINTVQVTLGQIALAVSQSKGLMVYFTETTALLTDTVYVGVVFPHDSGDALAVLTNNPPIGPDGNGWVYGMNPNGSGPVWNSYNNNYQFGGGSLGNYIKVTMCNTPPMDSPAAAFIVTNNNLTACSPDPYTFTDTTGSTPGHTTWTWSFGDGQYSNDQNTSHTYDAGGSYTVTESVTNDTGSVVQVLVSSTYSITVTGSPAVAATVTPADNDSTANGSAYITVTGGSGHHFATWSTTDLGDSIFNVLPGTYVVTVTDQNGCSVVDSVVVPSADATSIVTLSAGVQVRIYPSPAIDALNLEWSQPSNADISVTDLSGNTLGIVSARGDLTTRYDLRNLASGIYILHISESSKRVHNVLFTKL